MLLFVPHRRISHALCQPCRTYQQYIEDALNTILHGKPADASAVLKRAFSSSSETSSFLDAATAAASAAAGAPAAAITAALAATSAPAATPAAPPAASAMPARRSASVASRLSNADVAAPAKHSISATSAPGPADSAAQPEAPAAAGCAEPQDGAAAQQGRPPDTSGDVRDKAEVPAAADIAAELYRLQIGGETAAGGDGTKRPGMYMHTPDTAPVVWHTVLSLKYLDVDMASMTLACDTNTQSNAAAAVEGRVGDRVLLCEERLDFHCTVEESPGMPWARAKFQVPLPAGRGSVL